MDGVVLAVHSQGAPTAEAIRHNGPSCTTVRAVTAVIVREVLAAATEEIESRFTRTAESSSPIHTNTVAATAFSYCWCNLGQKSW
jgi:hypothetical protein